MASKLENDIFPKPKKESTLLCDNGDLTRTQQEIKTAHFIFFSISFNSSLLGRKQLYFLNFLCVAAMFVSMQLFAFCCDSVSKYLCVLKSMFVLNGN